jgi:hypothetical protein
MDKLILHYQNSILNFIDINSNDSLLSLLFKFMNNNHLEELLLLKDSYVFLIDIVSFPEYIQDLELYEDKHYTIEDFIQDETFEDITRIILHNQPIQNPKIINYIIETQIIIQYNTINTINTTNTNISNINNTISNINNTISNLNNTILNKNINNTISNKNINNTISNKNINNTLSNKNINNTLSNKNLDNTLSNKNLDNTLSIFDNTMLNLDRELNTLHTMSNLNNVDRELNTLHTMSNVNNNVENLNNTMSNLNIEENVNNNVENLNNTMSNLNNNIENIEKDIENNKRIIYKNTKMCANEIINSIGKQKNYEIQLNELKLAIEMLNPEYTIAINHLQERMNVIHKIKENKNENGKQIRCCKSCGEPGHYSGSKKCKNRIQI